MASRTDVVWQPKVRVRGGKAASRSRSRTSRPLSGPWAWLACCVLFLASSARLAAGDSVAPNASGSDQTSVDLASDDFEGFAEPFRAVDLAAGEPGVLTELRVREGATVKAGELIGRLDTLVLEKTLNMARHRAASEGARRSAAAELALARRTAEQLRQLQLRGNATASEVERAETDLAMAEARAALAREESEQQQLECERIEAQIARRLLTSPVDGVVSEVYREEGEAFQANDPRVVTIVQVDRLRVRLHVPPRVAAGLQEGQPVRVRFPELGREQIGQVEMVSPVIDARSGTRAVAILLDNGGGSLTSGLRCVADFARPLSETRRGGARRDETGLAGPPSSASAKPDASPIHGPR